MHFAGQKTYAMLVTFQKTEKEFSLSTMYADYPISRELLHWGVTGQHRTAPHRRPEPDSPSEAWLYDSGLCPWAEEEEQCHGAVQLSGAGGYGQL